MTRKPSTWETIVMFGNFGAVLLFIVGLILCMLGVFNYDLHATVMLQNAHYKNIQLLHITDPKCPVGYMFWVEYLADRSPDDYREHGYICGGHLFKQPIWHEY